MMRRFERADGIAIELEVEEEEVTPGWGREVLLTMYSSDGHLLQIDILREKNLELQIMMMQRQGYEEK
jgi:hypothetical protein